MKSGLEKLPQFEDYIKTFESQGTAFIFEDLVAEYYDPAGAVSFSRGNLKTCFFSKKTFEDLNNKGLALSSVELSEIANTLGGLVQKCLGEIDFFKNKTDFNSNDLTHMIETMGEICRVYLYFDFALWDKTFELAAVDKEAKKKVEIVQNFKNKLRGDMDPVFFGDGYFTTMLKQVSSKLNISLEELNSYRCSEIKDLFTKGEKLPQEEILSRKAYAHYIDEDHKIYFFSGEGALEFINRFLNKNTIELPENNIIQGKTANSTGKIVRAKVRILARDYGNPAVVQKSMAEMEDGEILVSQTTDPELLPAMKKASAIVTDIGGLLSHSAITSRELGIPCVIDTKNASKILKTGDFVEVDAEKGIVKIIR